MSSIVSIYSLSKSDKVFYVGQTTDPYMRRTQHIKKYGKDISMEILEEVENKKPLRLEREVYWINAMKDKGYVLENKIFTYTYSNNTIHVKLDAETYAKFSLLCKKEDRSENYMAREIITKHLAK